MWDEAQLAFHKSLFPLFCRDLPRGVRALFFLRAGIVLFAALGAVGRVTVFECANLRYCPRARRSHGDPANMTRENVC